MSERRRVIGYDKETRGIVKHVVCLKNNAFGYQAMLKIEGTMRRSSPMRKRSRLSKKGDVRAR